MTKQLCGTARQTINEESSDSNTLARRSALAALAMSPLVAFAMKNEPGSEEIELALGTRLDILRRAYQTGDARLMNEFYSVDIVFFGEGIAPVLGAQKMLELGQSILPKRRDVRSTVLRSYTSPHSAIASQLVRLQVESRDPNETLPVVTVMLLWRREPIGWRCVVELLTKQDIVLAG